MICGRVIHPTHIGIILQYSGILGSHPLHGAGAIPGTIQVGAIGILGTIRGTIPGITAGVGILGITAGADITALGATPIGGILGIIPTTMAITADTTATATTILTEVHGSEDIGEYGLPGPTLSADAAVTEWEQSPPMSGA